MKVFQIVLGLALVTTLTACNKAVEEAKQAATGAVNVVENATETVTEAGSEAMEKGGDMMEGAKEMGENAMEGMEEGKEMMGDIMEKGEGMMEKTGELMEEAAENLTAYSATYTAYNANAAADQKQILFFHADWCPTCVKWDTKINQALSSLPDSAVILKVDYDNNADLAAQYGVTKQSSAVFLNADGSVAKVESDPSVESVTTFFE